MKVQVEVFAKPGELMQGLLPSNVSFLLSNKSSSIFKSTTILDTENKALTALHEKSQRAVKLFWDVLEETKNFLALDALNIVQQSNIPKGKGLASSSADILGVLSALNIFYKTDYSIAQLYEMAVTLEPTDPCLHIEPVVFQQQTGLVVNSLADLPFNILYFDADTMETIDTVSFSQNARYTEMQMHEYERLCTGIVDAIVQKNYPHFYACITQSAMLNNARLPKNKFDLLLNYATSNAVGLFVAHSGSYMGLVFEPSRTNEIESSAKALIEKNWDTPVYIE